MLVDALKDNYTIYDMTLDDNLLESEDTERLETYLERNDHYSIDEKNKPKKLDLPPRQTKAKKGKGDDDDDEDEVEDVKPSPSQSKTPLKSIPKDIKVTTPSPVEDSRNTKS
jgi:hypothetical protein